MQPYDPWSLPKGYRFERPIYFFDSHGGLWATCDCNDKAAVSFGPRGAARTEIPSSVGLTLEPGETVYAAAQRAGRVLPAEEPNGWDLLVMS